MQKFSPKFQLFTLESISHYTVNSFDKFCNISFGKRNDTFVLTLIIKIETCLKGTKDNITFNFWKSFRTNHQLSVAFGSVPSTNPSNKQVINSSDPCRSYIA